LPTPIKVAAQVVEIVKHAVDLRSFVLVPSRRVPIFSPGQFLHLALDSFETGSHWPDSRVFSIASSPVDRERLRITISRQGQFTTRMFDELRVGSQVWLKLPYGTFCPNPDQPGRTVMIAGGSGITPFVSFLEWAVVHRPTATIDLHYGTRGSKLLIYRSAIERCIAAGLGNSRVRYYVEQTSHDEQLEPGLVLGRLSAEQAWNWLEAPNAAHFYLSGPKAMIESFRSRLIELGASASAVLSDDWS
jgi:ferredoxin-NADP reductase